MADSEKHGEKVITSDDLDKTLHITDEDIEKGKGFKGEHSTSGAEKTTHKNSLASILAETWDILSGMTHGAIPGLGDTDVTDLGPLNSIDSGEKLMNGDWEKLDSAIEILSEIAKGGQGMVNKAFDKKFNRVVALKSLNTELIDKIDQRKAFVSEAMMTAQLDHPAIVPVYDIFEDDGNGLHISMKLVRGKNLKIYLRQIVALYQHLSHLKIIRYERKLLWERLEIFQRICDAISYVHHRNVIHRDLKPENIMIGDFHETYIMDWGIAEFQDPEKNIKKDKVAGTLQYIAPEIINKQPFDARSDIFLLGLILFEIVFLKQAYTVSHSVDEAIAKARTCQTESMEHKFDIKVDLDLKMIIAKALEPDPAHRYQTVKELENDLRNYSIGEEVSANPDGFIEKIMRKVRLHYKVMLAICAVLLLLFTTVSSISLVREVNHRRQAHKKDQVLSGLYSRGIYSCSKFDRIFQHYEYQLEAIASEAELLYDGELVAEGEKMYTITEGNDPIKAPPDFTYAPSFGYNVSFDYLACTYPNPEQSPSEAMKQNMLRFQPMMKSLRSAMLGSLKTVTDFDTKQADEIVRNKIKPPLSLLFVGFEDGFYIGYPYLIDYTPNFDPRTRGWYKDAKQEPSKAIWGLPYVDAGQLRDIVITCSKAVMDADGKFIGAAGIDVSLTMLLKLMEETGNHGDFIKNKILIDKEANIIADSSTQLNAVRTGSDELEFKKFEATNLNEIWERKNGWFFQIENGVNYLYFFLEIQTTDWLYIERIDFEELMRTN